jgi:hypothetical protein
MKQRKWLKRVALYAATAISTGVLLGACATGGPNTPDGCYGPLSYCIPFFGS